MPTHCPGRQTIAERKREKHLERRRRNRAKLPCCRVRCCSSNCNYARSSLTAGKDRQSWIRLGGEAVIDFSIGLKKNGVRPMQHVSAFSRPQTVPPVPAAVPKTSLWILDSWRDLILYVGTPLL